jgi:hypothetical protein
VPIALVFAAALAPRVHAQLSPFGGFDTGTPGTWAPGTIGGTGGADDTSQAGRQSHLLYGVDVGVGESDNVTLARTDKVSQTMAITDLDFAAAEKSRLLDLSAKGDFSYIDYVQGAYGPQLLGRFDGVGRIALVPDRITWVVQDDFGQAALDPYTPITPNNVENVNYFTTGPDFAMRLSAVNSIGVSLRYSRAQYNGEPFDSNRFSGLLTLGRAISAGATVSLNGETEKVLFDNTAENTDFERSSVYARYALEGARTDFEADLGGTDIDDSAHTSVTPATDLLPEGTVFQPASSTRGPLAKLKISRRLSPAARLTLSAGRELTDPSSSFSSLQSGAIGITGTASAIQTSASYTSTFASGSWTYVRNRTTLALSAHYERDSYPSESQFDLKSSGGEISIERRLSRAFTAQLLGRYYKNDYPNATAQQIVSAAAPVTSAVLNNSTDYSDALVGFSLAWRHGRALEVRLRFYHDSHDATVGNDTYRENRIFLTVGYRPRTGAELGEAATPP